MAITMSHHLYASRPPLPHPLLPTPSPPTLSRRLLTSTAISLPLLHLPIAIASDNPQPNNVNDCTTPTTDARQAFLDVSIAGVPTGRITIALSPSTPLATSRFISLITGTSGVSYRLKPFIKVTPSFIQHVGVRSYGVDAELARRTGAGLSSETLLTEWEAMSDRKCNAMSKGSVGIIVRNPNKQPNKQKLVARGGKLVVDEEEVGEEPNGTEFVIAVRDAPELEAAAVVVGKVVEGMEVVEMIAGVQTVNENSSSPYFRVAKLIGDKRAVVAERGFNRPYSKIVVTNCGLVE